MKECISLVRPALVVLVLAIAACSPSPAATGAFPMVVVAPDSTSGDFGPFTPGTTTSGIQETLNYCVQYCRDLYIKGGTTYNISSTIRIPAIQNFKIDGGGYVLNWTGLAANDMWVFNSGMDGHYTLGSMVYNGTGAALKIRPVNPVPLDQFVVFGDAEFHLGSIKAGTGGPGTGIMFDFSLGDIGCVDLSANSIENFAMGIGTAGATPRTLSWVRIRVLNSKSNTADSTLVSLNDRCYSNVLNLSIDAAGGTGVKGIVVNGFNNTFNISTKGGFAANSDIIFQPSSFGNKVNLSADASVTDPASIVSDTSTSLTNQITWTGSPIPVKTVSAGTGTYTYTQKFYPAIVRVVGGNVSNIKLLRGTGSIDYGTSRPDIFLGVGDKLQITSSVTPTLRITPQANG